MDAEQTIAEIEWLEGIFAVPDARPMSRSDLSAANRRHDAMLAYSPWFRHWQRCGVCGDRLTVFVEMQGDLIRDIGFQGSGCAISKASASMMTQSLKGKTKEQARALFEGFRQRVTGQTTGNGNQVDLGKLAVFAGVSEFPTRVKCATLAWHTLQAALEGKQESVSTE